MFKNNKTGPHTGRTKRFTSHFDRLLTVGCIVVPCLLFITVASFVSANMLIMNNNDNSKGTGTATNTSQPQWPLCQGYTDYDEALASSSPITNCTSIKQDASGETSFTLVNSLKSFSSQVGLSGQIHIPVKYAVLDSISSFKNNYVNDDQNLSLIYSVSWGSKYLAKPSSGSVLQISDDAKKLYESSSGDFVDRYGNGYISQIEAGVKLFVMLKMHFSTQDEKADFESKIGVSENNPKGSSADIRKVSLALKAMFDKQHNSGRVSIQAFQLGGDPSQLATIFKNNDSKGSADFDFSSISDANEMVTKLVGYISTLNDQLVNNQSSVFVFHIGAPFSYKTLLAEYNLPSKGNLTQETVKARDYINSKQVTYTQLKNSVALNIFKEFPDSFSGDLTKELTTLQNLRDNMHDYFDSKDSSTPQAQCYTPGSENGACVSAAARLKKLIPDNIDQLTKDMQQLNYTVNIGDNYAAYPVSLISKDQDGKHFKQHFVFFTLNDKKFESDIVVNKVDSDDNSQVDVFAHGLFSYVEQPDVTVDFNTVSFDENGNRITPQITCTKTGTHTFVDQNNVQVVFLNSLFKPYPAGKICLYSSAWVNIKLYNMDTNKQADDIPVYRHGEISAAVGNIIKIKPRIKNDCTREFIVTRPGNISGVNGKIHGLRVLPLYGSIKTSGESLNCGYFHVKVVADGSYKCPTS